MRISDTSHKTLWRHHDYDCLYVPMTYVRRRWDLISTTYIRTLTTTVYTVLFFDLPWLHTAIMELTTRNYVISGNTACDNASIYYVYLRESEWVVTCLQSQETIDTATCCLLIFMALPRCEYTLLCVRITYEWHHWAVTILSRLLMTVLAW